MHNNHQQQQQQKQQSYLGVTPPISTALPLKKELEASNDLLQTLRDAGLFESEEEAQLR